MKNNCDPENINLYDANNDVQENETFIKKWYWGPNSKI
jgi:hypothetical protein